MQNTLLTQVFIFLAAASLIVPLASRFKLGSVLGYLSIGILIGPYGFRLMGNAEQIMHFAEFGVIMMLFLIGLELEPAMLWRLRKAIIGLGSLQVLMTTLAFALTGLLLGFNWQTSLALSMAFSLSSTALVLQMLEEKNLLRTVEGETSFAVLLFQDIAVIGMLIVLPLLAVKSNLLASSEAHAGQLLNLPEWARAIAVTTIIGLLVISGHYFSRHLFSMIARTNLRELFTATSLALVVGITLLMQTIGASPALGAFVAGVVLANSEYKRTLETDIEPFKGLLLGLFFISVGMGMNFSLFSSHSSSILSSVLMIVAIKAIILVALGYSFGLTRLQTVGFALSLSQVGEFAFVLLKFAASIKIISGQVSELSILVVALSMSITPFLMLFYYHCLVPRFMSRIPTPEFDAIKENHPVILAGYGRCGQIIGRFLSAQKIHLTILEKDTEQIELLRKFGFKGYFGDASRLDLLKNAGAAHARLLIIAIADPEVSLEVAAMAKEAFPNLKIFARARNRRHAYDLHKLGVDYFKRDTFDSALNMARDIMVHLGHNPRQMTKKAQMFAQFDETSLRKSFEFFDEESTLISFSRQANWELERVLQADLETAQQASVKAESMPSAPA
ncbi:glutathione-regulated potassium efflux system [Legionella birminghamensis]|uniref:Glutathione-regulated potassium efflux system n=1 Tax=Legionella birminghamensis TaxID=28083 RepID=A0A378ID80_9GAMM|nr:monovalent cation:proton antiporter-2 (CPA2) family protein [Legionella birminghamensis]KTC68899.1 glutathione-regulated potassium efflux system [Legionella birminghamensis]STX33159.1 monovalent cation-H antiporter-2, CPA2 family [Legionella birminghamensis]